jgi:hypothetical protein
MSLLQALEMDDKDFANDLLASLARHLGLDKFPRVDQAAMQRELQEAAGQAAAGTAPSPPHGETDVLAELLEETSWRLKKMAEAFGFLAEGVSRTRTVTAQDYQAISECIDKLFSGETHFFKQYDQEKLVALAARVAAVKHGDELKEMKTWLGLLESSHWGKRDYSEMINQLKRYQELLKPI